MPTSATLLPTLQPNMIQPTLTPFIHRRWPCHKCGFFESWTDKPLTFLFCFNCKQRAFQMPNEMCKVMTARTLPFVSKPRGNTKTFEAEYTFSERATAIQRRKRN